MKDCNETSTNHYEWKQFESQFGSEIFALDDNDDPDYCKRYPLINPGGSCNSTKDFNLNASDDDMVVCTSDQDIIYGEFGMDSTVVTRFNLVCNDQYKVHLIFSSLLIFLGLK